MNKLNDMIESYEDRKNKVGRDESGNIISANGFGIGDYVAIDRWDRIFRVVGYSDIQNRSYINYDGGISPIDDFFHFGYRVPTKQEIDKHSNGG